jgi:hypothetical protein
LSTATACPPMPSARPQNQTSAPIIPRPYTASPAGAEGRRAASLDCVSRLGSSSTRSTYSGRRIHDRVERPDSSTRRFERIGTPRVRRHGVWSGGEPEVGIEPTTCC